MPSLVPAPRRAGWEYLTAWHWHLKSRLASKSAVFMSRLGMQWCDDPHCPIVPGMLRSPQSTFLWGLAGNAERADQECAFLPLSILHHGHASPHHGHSTPHLPSPPRLHLPCSSACPHDSSCFPEDMPSLAPRADWEY